MTRRESMLDKVRKLLAQADSVAGTPEADAFTERAFALIAREGITEAEARNSGSTRVDASRLDIVVDGPFRMRQMRLLATIADAVHCRVVSCVGSHTVQVFGMPDHLDRVQVLFAVLQPQMLRDAAEQDDPANVVPARKFRESWMVGFTVRVGERLRAAEAAAAAAAESGTALVLVRDDEAKAWAAVQKEHGDIPTSDEDGPAEDLMGYLAGSAAAQRAALHREGVAAAKTAVQG